MKSISKSIDEKNKMIEEKMEKKSAKAKKLESEALKGKVREGPKIGKKKYQFREYIPSQE